MAEPKFYITDEIGGGGGGATIWTDLNIGGGSFKIVDEEVKEEEFSREKLNGKMKLTRDNYTFVNSADFDTLFTVILVLPGDPVSLSLANWQGEFFKTDCEFFPDNERVEVQPRTVDLYKEIIEGVSKEFDLIQLEPPLTKLQLIRRAILQIYVRGANKITNYVDAAFWEEVTTNPSEVHSVLEGTYRFGYSGRKYFVTGSGTGLSADVSGVYIYDIGLGTSLREDGVYRLGVVSIPDVRVRITRESDGFVEYLGAIDDPIPNIPVEAEQGVLLTSQTDGGVSKCRAFYVDFYSRILTKAATVDGNATFAIPGTDIVDDHGVFTRIYQIDYTDFLISEDHTTEGTRWGVFPDTAQHFPDEHFSRPTGSVFYPVLQSDWLDASFWVEYDAQLIADLSEASETYIVNHCYKVVDVVSKLLEAVGSGVTHEETSGFSDFLYGVSNTIRGVFKTPIIVPITNILVGDYDEPQPVVKITLKDIFDLYRQALRVYYRVNDDSELIFEHLNFFENGGSYAGEVIGTDLTGTFDPMTGKAWATAQNTYKFEKAEMPERYEFGWQGKSSKPFIGYPMDILSEWVEKGKVEKWSIGRFNSDIDLIHNGGSDVSKDGFLFVEAVKPGTVYEAPLVNVVIDSEEEYNLQNGYASFAWLVPNLHKYGLPASDININRYATTAITLAKRKLQEIIMSTSEDIGTLELTTTEIGNGKAYRVERDIFSNEKNINLRHVTE